jgi:hypothetical protein
MWSREMAMLIPNVLNGKAHEKEVTVITDVP